MTSEHRQSKVSQELAHLAADFLARESNRGSLITVTRADLTDDLKNAVIFFTVLPETMETHALAFAKRNINDFRIYVRKHSRIGFISHIDFEIDYGEKNRQRIDDLTRQ